jgi:hypothetical protein
LGSAAFVNGVVGELPWIAPWERFGFGAVVFGGTEAVS